MTRSDQDSVLEPAALALWQRLLARRPDHTGGEAIVVATSSRPPAVSLLTASSVRLRGTRLTLAVHSASSVARLDADSATLLSALDGATLRLYGSIVDRRTQDHVTVVDVDVDAVAALHEDPWDFHVAFTTARPDAARPLLSYWAGLSSWLDRDDGSLPPAPS
ncbi:MAG: hypothetical protein JWR62_2825 [Modestobacter sp.]|nr:hypothetical protein [Modestobacter sp.]